MRWRPTWITLIINVIINTTVNIIISIIINTIISIISNIIISIIIDIIINTIHIFVSLLLLDIYFEESGHASGAIAHARNVGPGCKGD